jgi:hypothetical protein
MAYGGKGLSGTASRWKSGARHAPPLAILLVWGLLVCHGAVSGLHLPAAELPEVGEGQPFAAAEGPMAPPIGEHSVEYVVPGLSYALALLVTLLAAKAGWPGRVRTAPSTTPSKARPRAPAGVYRRGSPPTVTLLQVCRL